MAEKGRESLDSIKRVFLDTMKRICPDFKVDKDNAKVISDVFRWCIRDKKGALDPTKGLWLYGSIGSGKSTLMKGVMQFIRDYWLRDSGEKMNPRWMNVPVFCGKYATEGFSVFESIPMGLDEFGTEITPTNHMGNKLNVMSHLINTIYDYNPDIPYIITTNRSFGGILNSYGDRAIDRIGQLFNLVEMRGVSRRGTEDIWNLIDNERSSQK